MIIYISFFLTVTTLLYALIGLGRDRDEKVKARISRVLEPEGAELSDAAEEPRKPSLLRRKVKVLWTMLKRSFERKLRGETESKLEMRLLRAGRPFGMGPFEFRIFQVTAALALPSLFAFYGLILGSGIGGVILFGLAGFAAGMLLPSYYLKLKMRKRNRLALKELPDVLDLLTVSLEAGLGFDAALSKLVSKSEGVLAAEFQRCLEEIRLGKTRREALIGIRERVQIEELKVLISSILQAEKLGIGMVQVLRVQSQEVRERRKQRAEEAAMKAPIKMLFPLVLFIFPSLFIVLLGPAVIQFLTAFN